MYIMPSKHMGLIYLRVCKTQKNNGEYVICEPQESPGLLLLSFYVNIKFVIAPKHFPSKS